MQFILALLLPCQFVPSERFSIEDQRQAVSASVRIIDWSDRGGRAGTGSIVGSLDDRLYVLTAFHVVDPGEDLELQWFDNDSYPAPYHRLADGIEIIATSRRADLALLEVRTTFRPKNHFRIANSATASRLSVLTIGCDHGAAPTCWVDEVKGQRNLSRPRASVRFWITEQSPVIGRSGGPLVSADGLLIGVCRGYLAETTIYPAEGIYSSLEEIHRLIDRAGIALDGSGLLVAAPETGSQETASRPLKGSRLHDSATFAAVEFGRERISESAAD